MSVWLSKPQSKECDLVGLNAARFQEPLRIPTACRGVLNPLVSTDHAVDSVAGDL